MLGSRNMDIQSKVTAFGGKFLYDAGMQLIREIPLLLTKFYLFIDASHNDAIPNLCNSTSQKSQEARPGLSLAPSRCTSLHNTRYGIIYIQNLQSTRPRLRVLIIGMIT